MATTYINPFVFAAEELGGMVLLTPSSVDITGGGSETATTLANGSVEFSACATLSLNGVFSADYDNYLISMRHTASSTTQIWYRMRSGGSDNSTANSYTWQYLQADGSTVNGARSTNNYAWIAYGGSTQREGHSINVYGPYLAQPTAVRSVSALGLSDARILDNASTHNQSTSYDGITIYPQATYTFTGLVSVYGLVGA